MKLENYGYKEKVLKARRMTLAEMRIGVLKMLSEKGYNFAHIRLVDIYSGDIDVFNSTNDFLMADVNESWQIDLFGGSLLMSRPGKRSYTQSVTRTGQLKKL